MLIILMGLALDFLLASLVILVVSMLVCLVT